MRVYWLKCSNSWKLVLVSFAGCGLILFNIIVDNNIRRQNSQCRCNEDFKHINSGFGESSTCSKKATSRGKHQKVVSYSFYGGTNISYFKGIEEQAKKVYQFYPGWVMRVYHDVDPSDVEETNRLCEVVCKYPHIDGCFIKALPTLGSISERFGSIWRFMVMGDPLVDVFIVRDLDSLMVQREVDAVDDWLRTNATWHIMRDNPLHSVSILAGMWGAKNSDLSLMEELRSKLLIDHRPHYKQLDQTLLETVVWPVTLNNAVVHDSFLCTRLPENTRPFPTRRVNGTFVGGFEGMQLKAECPYACRPNDHKDWMNC